ncbi:MAG: DNA polymerase III subunit alpha [Endomicrobium sp.]|jgi:DNA polymerase-3 subunit alpha|nr:DNA polymerase III subunit alpha [Endomicrobium sp.]
MTVEFVHLHNHTEYSLLDGACRIIDNKGNPGELFNIISDYKMPALAITDHGNMYGAMEFYWAAKQSGIKPIIGCEVYVAAKSRFDKSAEYGTKYNHLTLLAKDFEGYQNLMHIVSIGFTEGFYYKPRVDKDILEKYSKGLVALSGCLAGEIQTFLLNNNTKEARDAAIKYRDIFGVDNFYIEIMDNGLEKQKKIIPKLIDLSKNTLIPIVATNDCHFLKREDFEIHDILLCIGTGKMLSDIRRLRFQSDLFYYRSAEDMIKTFYYIPEAIKNTIAIAEKINLEIPMNKLLLPKFVVPKEYSSDMEYLEALCSKGLHARYSVISPEHNIRLKQELSIINKMGFASYFLIVSDFVRYAKDHSIQVGPGRGSGAGSMVAYVLGVTDICPLKYGLLFERFLNPERCSMPDLDIDFADSGRDEVIKYVRQKYGEEKCAQIITFGSMQAKLVIKDVARVMGFTATESNNIAKFIPSYSGVNISEALETSTELSKLIETSSRIAKLIKISQKLEGLKRHTGVHAAGMVMANEEITNYSPLARAKGIKGVIITQYDGIVLSQLGLLKVDFLGLRTLTIIDESAKLIQKNKSFDLGSIPLDDKKTYNMLSEAKTMGIFQLESKGMRDLIVKLAPSNINDIIALIALYRPGPMGSGMLDDFVNRKHGKTKIIYDHPLQESILKDTYGVILYQEQVMKMSVELANFTPGEADNLRKAMSKKIPEVIEKQREKFINGAKKNGIAKKIAVKIFNNIVAFAGYGFNKSHSAAYGMISYKTAYLKANYPLEYFTALLNSEINRSTMKDDGKNKFLMYLDDMSLFGIKILPPDIQHSKGEFSIENENIRFGLLAIKNVGESVSKSIEQARIANGQFKNWDDFLSKIDLKVVNKKALENLIKAGVFDCFGSDKLLIRAVLIRNLNLSVNNALKIKQNKESLQGSLFGSLENFSSVLFLKEVKPLEQFWALNFEKDVLGFYLSGHPLDKKMKEIAAYSDYNSNQLHKIKEDLSFKTGQIVHIAGMVTSIKKLISKAQRKTYAKFKIEDLYGSVDAVLFPKNFEKFCDYLIPNNVVIMKGRLTGLQSQTEIIVEGIITIDEAKKKFPLRYEIHIKLVATTCNDTLSEKLKKILNIHKGKVKVYLDLEDLMYGVFSVETGYMSDYSDSFVNAVETVIGSKDSVKLQCVTTSNLLP